MFFFLEWRFEGLASCRFVYFFWKVSTGSEISLTSWGWFSFCAFKGIGTLSFSLVERKKWTQNPEMNPIRDRSSMPHRWHHVFLESLAYYISRPHTNRAAPHVLFFDWVRTFDSELLAAALTINVVHQIRTESWIRIINSLAGMIQHHEEQNCIKHLVLLLQDCFHWSAHRRAQRWQYNMCHWQCGCDARILCSWIIRLAWSGTKIRTPE